MITRIKTEEEISNMRTSGKMLASVLSVAQKATEPGISLLEINTIAKDELSKLGGTPAFYKYQGFPGVVCTSLNEEVVHGIPSDREIQQGDIVSYDFGVNYQGMITDSAISFIAGGETTKDISRLLEATKESMHAGIKTLRDGTTTGDIGAAVQAVLERNKLGIVRDLVGHGVGHKLHEEPNIPNYGREGSGFTLKAGMTVAIEPMAMLGEEPVIIKDDGWTVTTKDGSLSAHYEHTVLVTESGFEILTKN